MLSKNHQAVVHLYRMAMDLMAEIRSVAATQQDQKSRAPVEETMSVIQRYVDLLHAAMTSGSAADALKGANLMTSVNRGLGDISWVDSQRTVQLLGKALSDEAIMVAKGLRTELGVGY